MHLLGVCHDNGAPPKVNKLQMDTYVYYGFRVPSRLHHTKTVYSPVNKGNVVATIAIDRNVAEISKPQTNLIQRDNGAGKGRKDKW